MGKLIKDGVVYAGSPSNATNIRYDNTSSNISATNVQGALNDLDSRIGEGGGVSLTWEEYNQLSEEKQANGLYYITDYDMIGEAELVSYNNTNSGLRSDTVQGAIDEVVDETTGLKDALTEYGTRLGEHLTTSILEKALTLDTGIHVFHFEGSSYTGNDLANDLYAYGSAEVIVRYKGVVVTVILYGVNHSTPVLINYYSESSWSGWSTQFLPLTGGTLSGNWFGMADHFVHLYADLNGFQLTAMNEKSSITDYRVLSLYNAIGQSSITNALLLTCAENGTANDYKIFGDHNKPSGTYTGNGSATERVINTGGVGNNCLIWGNDCVTLFTANVGGVSLKLDNNSVVGLGATAYSGSGNIYLKTASETVNANGKTYYYQWI